jgi:hypothetical protein
LRCSPGCGFGGNVVGAVAGCHSAVKPTVYHEVCN